MGDPQADIWVIDLAKGSRTRLTFGGATHLQPSWSADGQRVIYIRQNGNTVISGTRFGYAMQVEAGKKKLLRTQMSRRALVVAAVFS